MNGFADFTKLLDSAKEMMDNQRKLVDNQMSILEKDDSVSDDDKAFMKSMISRISNNDNPIDITNVINEIKAKINK